MVLGEVGIDGVYAIDTRLVSIARETQTIKLRGALFPHQISARKTSAVLSVTVSRTMPSVYTAERYEIAHATKLAELEGGNVRADTARNTYIAPYAQLAGITPQRNGINVKMTYEFLCGRIDTAWALVAKIGMDATPARLLMRLNGVETIPTLEKI